MLTHKMHFISRRTVVASLLAALSNYAFASEVERWTFGPFSFPAIEGFKYKEGKRPAVYVNGSGAALLISVYWMDGDISADRAKELRANALAHSRKVFNDSADRFGKPIAPFATRNLPNGNIIGGLHLETDDMSGAGHLLQFCLISPQGQLALITIEGAGISAIALEKYEKYVFAASFHG